MTTYAKAQQPFVGDTAKTLPDIVISANKVEESKRTVSQQVQVINAREIEAMQAQTTADVIANSGQVSVQKSQAGGGSPIIRGFEANKIVLVIDGVRLNNLIYRGGHLQNIITMDNAILDRVEVLFGPASTIYGSDALGGVIHLLTKKPMLASGNKTNIRVNAFSRYGSVNREMTGHVDLNIGGKKSGSLTSFTYSSFDDLKGGKNQNPFYSGSYGERLYYVDRINGKDSLVKNDDRYVQTQSGYSQYDLLQKFIYMQNNHVSHGLNFQYSNSSDIPRYDRLTDVNGSGLSFAKWYYGPQERLLAAYDLNIKHPEGVFDAIHFGTSFQAIEESRHTRRFGSNNLSHRIEKVKVYGTNLDFQKIIAIHNLRFGIDAQYNMLKSTAETENTLTGETKPLDTRYPDGDNKMSQTSLYISHTWKINEHLTLTDGLRVGFASLKSTFIDTSFFHLPFTEAAQSNPVYSGSIGLIHTPDDEWKLSLQVATGYRVPNVDDLVKVFESSQGNVIVPNPNLEPEKTVTTEIGISKTGKHVTWENSVYYTRFIDAIVTDKFTFNGADSILYDNQLSQVMANQNKGEAYIYGLSSGMKAQCGKNLLLSLMMSYTYGRIKTDSSDHPLDHIPPFSSRLQLVYTNNNFGTDFSVNYNGWKKLKDYSGSGEDNQQYATADGMPAWLSANIHFSFNISKFLKIQTGVDNIFDTQYRVFASGINAPGRNLFVTARFSF